MQAIVDFLVEEPLLLLFIVAGLGYLLGHLKVRGISPVSYTHLDVYKRQLKGRSRRKQRATHSQPRRK